ncbi:hypothetical protein GE061_017371 [Apolygus lucorum]|uniref:Uncharacterized protein n=1 Tax=Apolygus lucorum TaxID=248454 RepID=A0A8S9XDI9_APOLU|nr:hypothetical protein GE061_017371 [Apolygus lucorum]
MATATLLKKLAFLTVLGTMDCWKIFLTVKNFVKTFNKAEMNNQMTSMNKMVDGIPKITLVRSQVGLANFIDICVILFIMLVRLFRIAFRTSELIYSEWQDEDKPDHEILLLYMFQETAMNILPILLFRFFSAVLQDGQHIRRKVVWLKDCLEIIFVISWITILSGLVNNDVLDPWIFFATGVIITLQVHGCWIMWLAIEDNLFYTQLENQPVTDKLKILWDFNTKNVKLSSRFNWEVNYVGTIGVESIHLDRNVLDLSPEHISALVSTELGQWKSKYSVLGYTIPVIRAVALGGLLMKSYNSPIVGALFGFKEIKDPSIPMFIAYICIWPSILDVINYVDSLFSTLTVLQGDRLALKRHTLEDLTAALYHVAGATEHHPIFDGLYSAWMLGRPTVETRISRMNYAARTITRN